MEPLNAKDVTVLWHGWLKKLGGFSKRWKRRYFVFLSTASGMKELRHYDTQKDVTLLLGSTPKGVIAMTDATGICCFLPPSPSAVAAAAKKHTMFNLMDSHDSSAADIHDQKFAILTPLHVHMLAFQSGREWANASESQQGLSLLATLSAFYSTVEVLHAGTMSKKRERTGHSASKHSIIAYWKRHFFMFLSSGDLLYFKDETMAEFQGRVDVRHAPTVRVTGERMLEEKKKEIGAMLLKLAKLPGAGTNDRESCLVWIATPPSKMFVLKLQEDHEGVSADGRRQELTVSAKKWLSLLLQGHAEAKYTQLEQCISLEKFEATTEVVSAVRAGIPDELRAAMWKGFSGASDLQRRAELKRTIRKVTKTFSIRSLSTTRDEGAANSGTRSFFDEMSGPLDPSCLDDPDSKMILSRLCAVATYEMERGQSERAVNRGHKRAVIGDPNTTETHRSFVLDTAMTLDEIEDGLSDSEVSSPSATDHSSKEDGRSKPGRDVFPSEVPASSWEASARRRLLIATSRFSPFSHPCPWKAMCLLLAYLDEDSAFWVINSIQDVYLTGYYHGYRPTLQVDVAAFNSILEERAPALVAHLNALSFPIDRTAEQWFLSLFTSTFLPLPTLLRVWDSFFAQGVRILFGVGLALFLRAEDRLFRAKSSFDARDILIGTERTSIDTDLLFSHALKDDLSLSGITEDRFEKVRARHRQRAIDQVAAELGLFKDKLSILSQLQDQLALVLNVVKRLLSSTQDRKGGEIGRSSPLSPFRSREHWGSLGAEDSDEEDGRAPMKGSLDALKACAKCAEDAILNVASDLNARQARWLALSSQLAGCPSNRGAARLSSDLQSWLLQVKEGKVSGAGLDALPNRSIKASRIEQQHGLFFEQEDCQEFSCLFSYRKDFYLDDGYTADDFLQAMVSTIKAACAVRLECIGSANRSDWHGGRWIQSNILFPVDTHDGLSDRARSSSRGLRRSVSNASKPVFASSSGISRRNPRSIVDDSEQVSSRSSLDDSVLRRGYADEVTQRQSIPNRVMAPVYENVPQNVTASSRGTIMGGSSMYMDFESSLYASMSTSLNSPTMPSNPIASLNPFASWQNLFDDFGAPIENNRLHQHHSTQYRQSEQALHSAVDSMMSCLSRFIRVDSRHPSTLKRELRDRALVLEGELVQELKEVEEIVLNTKELY